MDFLKDAANRAAEAVDYGWKQTARTLISSTKYATECAYAAQDRIQIFVETGREHWTSTEENALVHVRDRLRWVRQNPEVSSVGALCASLVVFSGPRQFLLRRITRMIRSEESMLRSVEQRMENLKTSVESHGKEGAKLQKSMELGMEEFRQGRQKLKSTNSQYETFSGALAKEIKSAENLLADLRRMPGRPSLAMRSEVANKLAELKKQKQMAEKGIYSIMSKGI